MPMLADPSVKYKPYTPARPQGPPMALESEQEAEVDEEEQRELERKFARRQLASNADRYAEPEPELDSEGEEVVEPEVDLSSFLERQKLSDSAGPSTLLSPEDEEEDVDTSFAHITSNLKPQSQTKKGKVQQIEWDAELEELSREKAAADATRGEACSLISSAVKRTAKQRGRAAPRGASTAVRKPHYERSYVEAPPLPTDAPKPEKSEKEDMENFLDDLLN
ncbi:hypothetical protein NUW54_g8955 [Trametes sanguinea]|uniref:Uncharacterized protein n=1 Tax=Trametes sanguinea TaxID=158606 RepID=A0ACC1PAY3_9APHY|nr:hypothetical protein NUW54_g8955 [Trametes sanguinea]